jgi:hypothetical protein
MEMNFLNNFKLKWKEFGLTYEEQMKERKRSIKAK